MFECDRYEIGLFCNCMVVGEPVFEVSCIRFIEAMWVVHFLSQMDRISDNSRKCSTSLTHTRHLRASGLVAEAVEMRRFIEILPPTFWSFFSKAYKPIQELLLSGFSEVREGRDQRMTVVVCVSIRGLFMVSQPRPR